MTMIHDAHVTVRYEPINEVSVSCRRLCTCMVSGLMTWAAASTQHGLLCHHLLSEAYDLQLAPA
eukprot:4182474-Amphidinium_carterae.2